MSDFSFSGSGYLNIVIPLCKGLAEMGHDIKAIGLGYRGEEHNFPFSIIPCLNFSDANAMMNNLKIQWQADIAIVAIDIPYQEQFIGLAKQVSMPIISIVPLENPPLTQSWSYLLQSSNKVFFISQLGADEGLKAGVESSEHLVVGMDTKSWRLRTQEEYEQGRKLFNISPETLVVITVADNQERKNLSKAMEIVSKVKKEKGIKVKYLLVTREDSGVGWKLRDLAMSYGIASEVSIFERGIPFKELYALYAISDVFLLTSKAEGLNMAVLESMCVGVPVVATNCGAMPELLGDGRGFLMDTEYSHIDPWGNSRRDFPNAESGVEGLSWMKQMNEAIKRGNAVETCIEKARDYMETRTWDIPTNQMDKAIKDILDVKAE